MLVLKPITHNTIWGGPRISGIAGVKGERIGHLYSVFCREWVSNTILNGEWRGKHLNDVFPFWKTEFGMNDCQFFPLTLALTEAGDNLSIQVHPVDEIARTIEHKARGKRESWYFIEAPFDGKIINGCTCKNTAEKKYMLRHKQYLKMADTLDVKVGDYVFVEPGTLHSITAGSLVYEIEEGADFTYRFYDYDRLDDDGNPRELHIKKAEMTLDIKLKSIVKDYPENGEIVEKTYSTKKITEADTYTNHTNTIECFTLIDGCAICDGVMLSNGMTVILWPEESIENADIKLAFVAKYLG